MSQPLGPWLVNAAGIGFGVAGVVFIWRAWRAEFRQHIAEGEVKPWIVLLGQAGIAARGVAFVLVGGFLILAGLHGNPQEAEGLGGALARLQEKPYGWLLLGVTAAGLVAYGLFALGEAFYRRISAPDLKSKLKAAI